MKELSPGAQKELNELLEEFPTKQSAIMMALRVVEKDFGCIDDDAMKIVAYACHVTTAHVLGMVTFYSHFKRPFHGKYRFMVCATLMCSLGNCESALAVIEKKLKLKPGQLTVDGLFSVEKVECLADCDKPPVLQMNFEHYTNMTSDKVEAFIDSLLEREGISPSNYHVDVRDMDSLIPFIPVKENI